MMTGRTLIKCIKSMPDAERREVAELLLSAVAGDPALRGLFSASGTELNQAILDSMNQEHRERLQRICYSGCSS